LSLGLGPEAPVALLLEPSEYVPILVLAVWKAGLSYVPLSAHDPPTRQCKVVEESGARVLLSDGPPLENAPDGVRCLSVRELVGEVARLPASRTGIAVHPRQRAYILFTSGSTGAPKGIEIEHRGIVNMVSSTQEAYHLTARDSM